MKYKQFYMTVAICYGLLASSSLWSNMLHISEHTSHYIVYALLGCVYYNMSLQYNNKQSLQ